MGDFSTYSRLRRSMLMLIPAAITARLASGQTKGPELPSANDGADVRLPNGKRQQDEILKAEYEKNVKDAQELVAVARSFEEDLEKDDRFVLSLSALKKLDDIEKLTKRIRGRMKRF